MTSRKVTIALVQMASTPLDRQANLTHIDKRLAPLAGKADIAVMPECADVGYLPDSDGWLRAAVPVPGPSTEELGAIAKRHGIAIICGVLEADQALSGLFYSTAVVIEKNGNLIGAYRKSHLFPTEHRWLRPGC